MAKALSVKIEDTEDGNAAIQAALDAAQGPRRAAIETASDVLTLARWAEETLDGLDLPASYRSGAIYKYHQGGPSANAYRYPRKTTVMTLKRKKDGWHLVAVDTIDVYPKEPEYKKVWLTAKQDETVKRRFTSQYAVMRAA